MNNNNKQPYEPIDMTVIYFEEEDIITTSDPNEGELDPADYGL